MAHHLRNPSWLSILGPTGLFFLTAGSTLAAGSPSPKMTSDQYQLLYSVPAIIYGLALANLVGEVGGLVRARRSVPRSVPHIIWILVVILFILIMFFSGTKFLAPLNHFGVFLATIGLAMFLYLAADSLVIPSEKRLDPNLDYRKEFKSRDQHFVGYTILALLWLTARDWYMFHGNADMGPRVAHESSLRFIICGVLLIPLFFPKTLIHIITGVLCFAALIYHVYTTQGFLFPLNAS
jgi:hypothetical protein